LLNRPYALPRRPPAPIIRGTRPPPSRSPRARRPVPFPIYLNKPAPALGRPRRPGRGVLGFSVRVAGAGALVGAGIVRYRTFRLRLRRPLRARSRRIPGREGPEELLHDLGAIRVALAL